MMVSQTGLITIYDDIYSAIMYGVKPYPLAQRSLLFSAPQRSSNRGYSSRKIRPCFIDRRIKVGKS